MRFEGRETLTTAAVRNSIRTGLFVAASFVAVLAAEGHAHADDPAQAATPAPDPNAGGATPPPDTTPTPPPATPGGSVDVPTTPSTPPDAPTTIPSVPTMPGGSIDVPAIPTTPTLPAATPPSGDETATPGADGGWPTTTGNNTSQDAEVTTGGSAVANTGGNTGVATGPGLPGIYLPGGVSSTITTGSATGNGSVDTNGISQEINATVTENGKVVVVQVAVIVNIGIGLAGSGGNVANTESVTPPKLVSSVAMIVGSEAAGAGTGPTPTSIMTGNASSTGNSGSTQVTQSIVLTGNDVAQQLAAVLNLGVGVANSGLNFALAAVSGNNQGSPSSVTFVTTGAPSSITAGSASALGNRSTSAVFQVVTVSASGNGSLLVIQRAVIVNFGLALANSGLNVAGGGALTAALPDPAAAQQLLLMLLGSDSTASGTALAGGSGPVSIGTGNAQAVGNDTTTGILQQVNGSVTGDETAKAIQDAWVGNFGLALANTGANGAATGLAGIDPASLVAARGALQAFLAGLTGIGDPLQGLDASFQLGGNLLQLHGDVSGTESLARHHRAGDGGRLGRRRRRGAPGDRRPEHRPRDGRVRQQRRGGDQRGDRPHRRRRLRCHRGDDHDHDRRRDRGGQPLRDHGVPDHRRRARLRGTGRPRRPRQPGHDPGNPGNPQQPTDVHEVQTPPVPEAPATPGAGLGPRNGARNPPVHGLPDRRGARGWIRTAHRGDADGSPPSHRSPGHEHVDRHPMSVPARKLTPPEPTPPPADDSIIVTCGACNSRQQASGTASGFTCSDVRLRVAGAALP